MENSTLSWKMYEYEHTPKTSDWYWALGIVAIAIAIVSIFLGNLLFGLFAIIAAVTLALHAAKPPRLLDYHLTPRGVIIEKKMYPHHTLDSFWVVEYEHKANKILLKSSKLLMPYIVMPLPHDIHPDEARVILFDLGLPEVEHHEPLVHEVMEYLGF